MCASKKLLQISYRRQCDACSSHPALGLNRCGIWFEASCSHVSHVVGHIQQVDLSRGGPCPVRAAAHTGGVGTSSGQQEDASAQARGCVDGELGEGGMAGRGAESRGCCIGKARCRQSKAAGAPLLSRGTRCTHVPAALS